jgi:hypothetical protein
MNGRATFRQLLGAAALLAALAPGPAPASPAPVRAITRGPKHHWFGYYDKLEFDPTGRYVLGMAVGFEGRSPTDDDVVEIGMVDLQDGDRWIPLGESRSWCWQQGCMLQWRPGSKTEVLWNDREGDRFVCRILDVETRKSRTIPWPVYTLNPDGRTAVTPDFRRIQDMRPGYGYPGLPDPHQDDPAPKDSGIWSVDLDTGRTTLLVSLADIVGIPLKEGVKAPPFDRSKHWFNHLLFSTDGKRFVFLHRWRPLQGGGFSTRMCTANADGSDVRVVDPYGQTSHFIWRDPAHLLAWSWHPLKQWKFYLYEDGSDRVETVGEGVMTQNGHCTCLPGNAWILNDTYPTGPRREQAVYLFEVAAGRAVELGRFPAPPAYKDEWRCDTHPRFSPDGDRVVIDSAHGGDGRQLYLIDITGIVKAPPTPR